MSVTAKAYIEHELLALVPTLRELDDINIKVIHEATTDPDADIFPFVVEYDDIEALERTLDTDPTVVEYGLVDNTGDTSIYYIEHTEETKLISPAVTDINGFMLHAETKDKGWLVQLQVPSREALQSVWEYAREHGISFSLLEMYEEKEGGTESSFGLTAEQREALEIAYRSGYFSEPREMSLSDVADELGVSSTAMGGRLRRGMRNLISSTLIDEEEQ
jgi:predicted DNA binding protein